MEYFFGFAGIPRELREKVEARNSEFAKGAGFCIDKMPSYVPYGPQGIDFFMSAFQKKIDSGGNVAETAFAIIYLVRDLGSSNAFANAFFPHTMMVPVEWQWDGTRLDSIGKAVNELTEKLKQATAIAREALSVLRDEVCSRAQSTPILLPVQNFNSRTFVPALQTLHLELATGILPSNAVFEHRKRMLDAHPMQRIEGKRRDCFVDDRQVEFHPPGNDRHGFSRSGGSHNLACLLSGRRRLGAPYDQLFHYDCTKGTRNLKGQFLGCHSPAQAYEGNPHLNIAPNDHVRA
ncbi:hypothetical protein DMX02_28935 [Pseudomonas jessenii]|nr:hypothetical protein DMX02_28935 [Pseudomonas jessenii]